MMPTKPSSYPKSEDVEDNPYSIRLEQQVITEHDEESVFTASHVAIPRGLNTKQKAAQEERSTLANQESHAIFWLRCIVLLVLIMVGATFAGLVFHFTNKGQEERFVKEFGYYSEQVAVRFQSQLKRTFDATDTLSTDITSHALATGAVFPFVTLPDFELKGANARITGDASAYFYMPYVTEESKDQWESYAATNRVQGMTAYASEEEHKIEQDMSFGLETPEIDGAAKAFLNAADEVLPLLNRTKVWNVDGGTPDGGAYFPLWQLSPAIPADLLNLDMGHYDFLKGAAFTSADTGEVVFGGLIELTKNLEAGTNHGAFFELLLQSSQYRHAKKRYTEDPASPMLYPVFDRFGKDRKVGGILYTSIYWRFMMMNILPENVRGIVCVVGNSDGQKHTYVVNGNDAVHLGEGDIHDDDYSHMGYSIDLVDAIRKAAGPESRSFTASGVNGQFMNYTLTVYPSMVFKEIFADNRAQRDASTIAVTFAVAICLFLIYDYYVQRRQTIVLDRAVRATAVVSSLFPANVREQIINDEANDPSQQHRRAGAFLGSTVEGSASNILNPTPLATKYPNCTVYFADLVGFTKWSSTREPEMVFHLLEAIFKEFDAVAARWGVFKVETVGDCYMAVTGLPNPQPDHAVLMAKFAHDCMVRVDQVVERLATTLGEGTGELTLRTGMHSGEVTAGVLRGEKGRFQLFGDTVNTASRMESTGIPRKIQVSQSTADALNLGGKGHWLIPRGEKVYAKGKGDVQTYFLEWKERTDRTERTGSISQRSSIEEIT